MLIGLIKADFSVDDRLLIINSMLYLEYVMECVCAW